MTNVQILVLMATVYLAPTLPSGWRILFGCACMGAAIVIDYLG